MEQDIKQLQFTDTVPVLMLPIQRKNLLLPNVNVAEFVPASVIEPLDSAPPWLLGMMEWRGQRVPLISFEQLNGDAIDPTSRGSGQVAILNGISDREELKFYGIRCFGIPRQARIVKEDLKPDNEAQPGRVELSQVELAGDPAVIPDLEIIEAQIARVLMGQ
ncbi:chemosensory pili system protein ChpC [Litorivivens lipolytica]|uniref:Chemosensory pili system protein ChpC n=1 Tax=Litorivivens lipolytica TaxID=1524264 RepID=A0A7W4W6I7_9GAMM|nr:chemotaxis protein CheW [Litorivivens lipolytica]MBB3048401.1 chemosensory pili system protein ChpC [Litorivivens lipolytica]